MAVSSRGLLLLLLLLLPLLPLLLPPLLLTLLAATFPIPPHCCLRQTVHLAVAAVGLAIFAARAVAEVAALLAFLARPRRNLRCWEGIPTITVGLNAARHWRGEFAVTGIMMQPVQMNMQ